MGYEASLERAWDELDRLALQDCSVSLLGEDYQVRAKERAVLLACGAPAGQMQAVLILHYLIGLLRHGYRSQWRVDLLQRDQGRQALLAGFSGERHKTAGAELSA